MYPVIRVVDGTVTVISFPPVSLPFGCVFQIDEKLIEIQNQSGSAAWSQSNLLNLRPMYSAATDPVRPQHLICNVISFERVVDHDL